MIYSDEMKVLLPQLTQFSNAFMTSNKKSTWNFVEFTADILSKKLVLKKE